MMFAKRPCQKLLVLCIVLALVFSLSAAAFAGDAATFIHYKTGVATEYTVLEDGTAALGNGTSAAIPADTDGTVIIPADVTYMEAWETVYPYGVSRILANAFVGCANVDTVYIEGEVALDDNALDGLGTSVVFETGSEKTKNALIVYGIDASRVTYTAVGTKLVAFGDSIAAGYALETYPTVGTKPEMKEDTGDAYPTPADAFVSLVGAGLDADYGPVVVDNQAVSGWTSRQLLDQLKAGDYDSALADADVVTVTIGSNDLLGTFIELVMEEVEKVFGESDNVVVYAPRISPERIEIVVKKVTTDTMLKLATVINNLNTSLENNADLYAGCEQFKTVNQPEILKLLQEKAPDAEIYWTTLYNPFYGAKIDVKALFPGLEKLVEEEVWASMPVLDLSTYGAQYIEEMNKAFDVNTEGYHRVELYEDFNNAGLTNVNISRNDGGTPDDLSDDNVNLGLDPHPNTAGHKVIADILLPVITSTYPAEDNEGEDNDPGDGEEVKTQVRVVVTEGIKTIPEGLKATAFDTEAKIKTELIRVANKNSKFTVNEKNTVVWDVTLQISTDGGKTWHDATAADIPKDGLTAVLPYPTGTNGSEYDFTVIHMLTAASGDKKAGDTEILTATKLKSGLQVKFTSLSPVSVSWNKITNANGTVDSSTSNKSPQTGDEQTIVPYIILMFLSLCGITWLIYRRKQSE